MKARIVLPVILCLAFALLTSAQAQDVTPTKVNDQNRTGDLPFSTSVGTGIEHVDVASGNLVIRIPILTVPGRGMDTTFFLRYDALFWIASRYINNYGNYVYQWKIEARDYIQGGGGTTGLGWEESHSRIDLTWNTISCTPLRGTSTYDRNYIYTDREGGKHRLAVQSSSGSCSRESLNKHCL